MNGKTHGTTGALFGAAISAYLVFSQTQLNAISKVFYEISNHGTNVTDVPPIIPDTSEGIVIAIGALACMIGALLPDIDIRRSTIGKFFKISNYLFSHLFEHRRFIHTPFFIMFVSFWALMFFGTEYYTITSFLILMAMIGFLIHLFQDTITTSGKGIMFLYPVPIKFSIPIEKRPFLHSLIICVLFGAGIVYISSL